MGSERGYAGTFLKEVIFKFHMKAKSVIIRK